MIATSLLGPLVQAFVVGGVVIGCVASVLWLPRSLPAGWTAEEVENVPHLTASLDEDREATQIGNDGGPGFISPEVFRKILEHKGAAARHARLVRDEVLAKAHPDLPEHFRQEYQRSLELFAEALGTGDNAKFAESGNLHDHWVDWWNDNRKYIRVPRR